MNQASDFTIRLKRSGIRIQTGRIITSCLLNGRKYASLLLFLLNGRKYASLLLLLLPLSVNCQNIYDSEHSREFAAYLMQTHQYQLAGAEWERVLFFSPTDSLARISLIRSLRFSQKGADGLRKLNQWFPTGPLSRPIGMEAIELTLMQGEFGSVHKVVERAEGLTEAEKTSYELGSWIMEGKWIDKPLKIRKFPGSTTAADPMLLDLYFKTGNIHRKSPAAAVALSTLVPGLGKVYSSDWKDGLLSLLFVATNAWQAYRGFSKNGVKSVSGWIFGGLALGFYSGNLFGSWKSAKTYNSKQVDLIRHDAEGYLFSH